MNKANYSGEFQTKDTGYLSLGFISNFFFPVYRQTDAFVISLVSLCTVTMWKPKVSPVFF